MKFKNRFFGWSVAWAAFSVAVFAWGVGFYGPSVFLHTLHETQGWSVSIISAAITAHFLVSAALIAFLPEVHRSFGIAKTTASGGVFAALGIVCWSNAWEPWHLFGAAIISGLGWALTSGAALNAIISRWFARDRPSAMGIAFNGASFGGVLFAPLWVYLIGAFGFQIATYMIGATMTVVLSFLSFFWLRNKPSDLGLHLDGDSASHPPARPQSSLARGAILRNPRFISISAAFSLGLFAQIGILAHLIIRLAPVVGNEAAGAYISLATICAVLGRTLLGWLIRDRDRRLAAAINFSVQIVGAVLLAYGTGWLALGFGCALFGLGIGNLTSLPPLIVQKEFDQKDVVTVVALVIAVNQALFAFAPVLFGVIHDLTSGYALPFAVAFIMQFCAAIIILIGRPSPA